MKTFFFKIPLTAAILFAACVNKYASNNSITSIISDSIGDKDTTITLKYSSPRIPKDIIFAGDTICLKRFDRREKMDRELINFTYMHSSTLQILKRANRYFPMIEPILKEKGVPDDFKYLMVIESSVNPRARSGVGAAGLWQFMPSTAKEYGLEISKGVDERYNIEKATRAACNYLLNAYKKYGDWASVAASYNAGMGRISSQLIKQRASNSLDLHLVEETSRYVYRILAAKSLFENPAKYGFRLKSSDLYPQLDTKEIKVNGNIADLSDWAIKHGNNLAILKEINPWLIDTKLENEKKKEYIIKIVKKEGLEYDPNKTVAHNKNWIVK